MTKLEHYLPLPQVLLAFIVSFLIMVVLGAPVYTDQDVLWHIATGDLILQMGALPKHDPWSFTAGNQPWYIISWLFDVILSLVHQWGGIKAVYLFPFFILAGIVALLVRSVMQRGGINSDVIIMLIITATMALTPFATSRPQIMAFFFAALMHNILHRSRDTSTYGKLLWLPVLMCLWVNMHGSFVVGLSLLGAYGLEALIQKQWARFKMLLIIGIACAVALLINPYGIGMITAMNRTLDSAVTKLIAEWLPFVFSNFMGLSAWVLLFIITSNFRENDIPIADKIVAIIWFVFMLFSMRHAGMFVVVSAPYLAISLQKSIDYLEAVVTKHPDPLLGLLKPGMQLKLAVLAAAVVIGSFAGLEPLKGEYYKTNKERDFTPAIAYLDKHYTGKRFLNDYSLGGQLVYQVRGRVPLFIDGRAGTAYPEELLKDYIEFLWLNEGWEELVDKYKLDGIIVANTHRFALLYKSGLYHDHWKEVFRDDVASIYIRNR